MDTSKIESHAIPRSALLFMAAVEEARVSTEGSIRAIAPIFRIALEEQRGELLNLEKAAKVLAPILGDSFTHQAFEAFIPQLEKLGWIQRSESGDAVPFIVSRNFPEFDASTAAEDSLARLDNMHIVFCEFLDEHAPLLKLSLDKDQFKWNLFLWCVSLDGSDKDAIKAEAEKLLSGERSSLRFAALDEPQRFSAVDPTLNIEFAAFAKWLAANERAELSTIASLTELGLAYEFLQELQKPSLIGDEAVDCLFVLDAPILLDIFGLSGPSRQTGIEKALSVLKGRGAQFVTLPHCLQELSDILKAVLGRSRKFGLTGDAITANPKLAQVARTVAQNPDKAAKVKGISVLPFDRNHIVNERYFPDALIDKFRTRANWHDFYKTNQREWDALSVAFVMRRRAGTRSSDVLDSKCILVSRNSTYAHFSHRFVVKNLDNYSFSIGPVIETKTLSAITWMRFGSDADENYPQISLIAACDRILASNGVLLRKAERQLKKVASDEVVEALLSTQQSVLDLVIGVGGNPEVIDGADAAELLRTITLTAEERGKSQERKRTNEVVTALEKERLDREAEKTELLKETRRLAAERERSAVAAENLRKSEVERRERLAQRLEKKSHSRAWNVVLALWLVIVGGAIYTQFALWIGPEMWAQQPMTATISVLLCLVVLITGLRFLPNGPDLIDVAYKWIAVWMHRRLIEKQEDIEDRNYLWELFEEDGGSVEN